MQTPFSFIFFLPQIESNQICIWLKSASPLFLLHLHLLLLPFFYISILVSAKGK